MLRTAKALKNWTRKSLGGWRVKWAALNIILEMLEKAQERRQLTPAEQEFKKCLKNKSLGMAAVQKSRARQHSRLTLIRKGDANTKYFQLHASTRKKKSFIATLEGESGLATTQDSKSLAYNHFSSVLGTRSTRMNAINWEELGYVPQVLDDLDEPFTIHEIEALIKEMPNEKAPGPDGFIGAFYKKCWSIIKEDFIHAITFFFNNRTSKFRMINTANIVLLPKKWMPQH